MTILPRVAAGSVNVYQAKTHLSKLLDRVANGERS